MLIVFFGEIYLDKRLKCWDIDEVNFYVFFIGNYFSFKGKVGWYLIVKIDLLEILLNLLSCFIIIYEEEDICCVRVFNEIEKGDDIFFIWG